MPGHKVYLQDDGEIRDGLTCSYCKLVLKDPVQTSETGQRLCRECCETATEDPSFAYTLDQNDEVWPDSAVKREIAELKVKCENYIIGCDWKGLFKQLMQHSQECQYVTVECECYQKMLLGELDAHLEECPQQITKCNDCGKEMYFIELQNHGKVCLYAPKKCINCKQQIPKCQFADHVINECKHVRCVCSKEKEAIYEVESDYLHNHLQDVSKLADHLGPMICEFTKMSGAFKEMTAAYQQATERIDVLERKNDELEQKVELTNRIVECLELKHELSGGHIDDTLVEELCDEIEELKVLVNELDKNNDRIIALENKDDNLKISIEQANKNIELLNVKCDGLVKSFEEIKSDSFEEKSPSDERIQLDINNNDDVVHYEATSSSNVVNIKVIEGRLAAVEQNFEMLRVKLDSSNVVAHKEKVLEIENILNTHAQHISELTTQLELHLQASLASTHNGAFLWCIPEVRRKIRDAKIGRITSICSPPFYTGRNGYKMCIRAFLNGDGNAEGTYLSIFFVLMKGEYDPLLQWPFESKVNLILVDQDHEKHLIQTFKPNIQSSSFQKPKTDMNVASGCPEFADLSILENLSYVKDDVMYIKAIVDTSKILHP